MSMLELEIYGARGESIADIARRTGNFGVGPYDTDAEALEKFAIAFAAVALETSPGIKGDPGSAGEGYATIAALALAGDTANNYDDAYLTESGREGKWVFSTDDLSAFVTVDTGQAFFVATDSDPTGASGAWVRVFDGPARVTWAGAMSAETFEVMANRGILGGIAGEILVETAPYPKADGLILQNATIRNTNTTSLAVNDYKQTALSLGFMAGQAVYDATKDTVSAYSNDRRTLTLPVGEGTKYEIGEPVMVHGATKYDVTVTALINILRFPRNFVWTNVVDKTANTITLDKPVPPDVIADGPFVVFQTNVIDATPYTSGDRTPTEFHVVTNWQIRNAKLTSDKGDPVKWGGTINFKADGVYLEGRHGISLNAMQDAIVTNVHGRFWRAALEIAQNSRGAVIRSARLWQEDPSTKLGGGSDQGSFIQHIGENSRDCLIDDAIVHAEYCDAAANAIIMGPGVNNRVQRSKYYLPRYTGTLVGLSSSEANNPVERSGFADSEFIGGACEQYFQLRTLSGSVHTKECYLIGNKFRGAVVTRAGIIEGTQGGTVVLNQCEYGSVLFNSTTENWRIEDNYFPGGFQGLSATILSKNIIQGNESDASRRVANAAVLSDSVVAVTATVANTVYQTMTIAAGDIAALDHVHGRVEGYGSGTDGLDRHLRVTIDTKAGTPTEIIDLVETVYQAALFVEFDFYALDNANATIHVRYGNSDGVFNKYVQINGGNLAANGCVVKVEIWSDATASVVVTGFAVAGQKAGMRNRKVFR